MCGIAGIVGRGAGAHADRVRAMVAALHHRGPDDSGVAVFENAVLGSARLSIIDLEHGHQPLLGRDDRTALVCNGEIYGHRRLRADLADYPFRTSSDSEVVLALRDRWGPGFLPRLPGTFSLALWDDREQSLLLARDRFGERPLYWARTAEGSLVFASEVTALLESGLIDAAVHPTALAHMLRQGYVPPEMSIWDGVASLGPACRLRWTGRAGARLDRWWDPPAVGAEDDAGEASVRIRAALERSVADQLEADVAVGTFLSGGIDSSAVAAIAGRMRPGLDAFAFDMPGQSEVPFAQQVANRHGLKLRVCRFDPAPGEIADHLVRLATVWDEPFGDSSALPTWLLSRFAREHVTVALTGDGADELLGGYLCWARGYLDPSDPARGGPSAPQPPPPRRWLRRRAATPRGEVALRYARFREYFDSSSLAEMGLPGVDLAPVELDRYREGDANDISRFDLDHYLPGDILVKTDRASMAHGLEVRSPFLGVEIAEACLALPAPLKVDAHREKVVLRDAVADLLPEAVVDRSKQGFGAPMERWLADPHVAELKHAHLVDPASSFFDLVDHSAVQRHVAADDQATWNLLAAALWWDAHRHRTTSR